MNNVAYFEIQSSNPARDIKFYQSVFGWKFSKEDTIPIEYYRIETTGAHGGLLQRPAPVPPQGTGTNAFVCSMEVENFDKASEIILENGGTIALEKFAVPGRCWQGYFLDPDNNTFGIFEVNPNAA